MVVVGRQPASAKQAAWQTHMVLQGVSVGRASALDTTEHLLVLTTVWRQEDKLAALTASSYLLMVSERTSGWGKRRQAADWMHVRLGTKASDGFDKQM